MQLFKRAWARWRWAIPLAVIGFVPLWAGDKTITAIVQSVDTGAKTVTVKLALADEELVLKYGKSSKLVVKGQTGAKFDDLSADQRLSFTYDPDNDNLIRAARLLAGKVAAKDSSRTDKKPRRGKKSDGDDQSASSEAKFKFAAVGTPPEVGKLAPDIKGRDLDGKEFSLSDYAGKVIVIDFWGDW